MMSMGAHGPAHYWKPVNTLCVQISVKQGSNVYVHLCIRAYEALPPLYLIKSCPAMAVDDAQGRSGTSDDAHGRIHL
jgi:hypothetical protein